MSPISKGNIITESDIDTLITQVNAESTRRVIAQSVGGVTKGDVIYAAGESDALYDDIVIINAKHCYCEADGGVEGHLGGNPIGLTSGAHAKSDIQDEQPKIQVDINALDAQCACDTFVCGCVAFCDCQGFTNCPTNCTCNTNCNCVSGNCSGQHLCSCDVNCTCNTDCTCDDVCSCNTDCDCNSDWFDMCSDGWWVCLCDADCPCNTYWVCTCELNASYYCECEDDCACDTHCICNLDCSCDDYCICNSDCTCDTDCTCDKECDCEFGG